MRNADSNYSTRQEYRTLDTHDLSAEERSILIKHFGPQQGLNQDADRVISLDSMVQNYDFGSSRGGSAYYAHPIVEVRTLTKSESWFFQHKGFVSPNFCVQLLYKVKGHVTRSRLNQCIYELTERNPELRASYCPMPRRILKIVFKDRLPKVVYQNINRMSNESIQNSLDRLMQKDRLEGFDLLHGPLFRITIFHTQDGGDETDDELYSNEYAILVTESHLIMDYWDPLSFIHDTFHSYGSNVSSGSNGGRLLFVDYLKAQDIDSSSSPKACLQAAMSEMYWKALLKDAPLPAPLPGYHRSDHVFSQEVVQLSLSPEDMKLLSEKANLNRSHYAAVLQVAWALLLQNESHTNDTIFCLIMPEPYTKARTAAQTAAIINPMLARIQYDDKEIPISELVDTQLRQMLTSQSHVWLYMSHLLEEIGISEDTFSHFLSFHGFLTGNKLYEEVPATQNASSVSMESWDSKGMDLSVYFCYSGETIQTTFRYNSHSFKLGSVDQLARNYQSILHHMLEDWDAPLRKFLINFNKAQNAKHIKNISQVKVQKSLQYLAKLDLFRAIDNDSLSIFSAASETYTCQKDSDIPSQEDVLLFLMWGSVDRWLEFPGGEQAKIERIGQKGWLNETAVLDENAPAKIIVTIASSPVVLMTVPLRLVRTEEAVFNHLQKHAANALNRYITQVKHT